jgi:hypothetical protein
LEKSLAVLAQGDGTQHEEAAILQMLLANLGGGAAPTTAPPPPTVAPTAAAAPKTLWEKYDKDGNGILDKDEMAAMLAEMNSVQQQPAAPAAVAPKSAADSTADALTAAGFPPALVNWLKELEDELVRTPPPPPIPPPPSSLFYTKLCPLSSPLIFCPRKPFVDMRPWLLPRLYPLPSLASSFLLRSGRRANGPLQLV